MFQSYLFNNKNILKIFLSGQILPPPNSPWKRRVNSCQIPEFGHVGICTTYFRSETWPKCHKHAKKSVYNYYMFHSYALNYQNILKIFSSTQILPPLNSPWKRSINSCQIPEFGHVGMHNLLSLWNLTEMPKTW